jgi:hypothetical protein
MKQYLPFQELMYVFLALLALLLALSHAAVALR